MLSNNYVLIRTIISRYYPMAGVCPLWVRYLRFKQEKTSQQKILKIPPLNYILINVMVAMALEDLSHHITEKEIFQSSEGKEHFVETSILLKESFMQQSMLLLWKDIVM